MKLSILMPARNAESFIATAIRSIQSATATEWELIVVEDHSDDGTWEIVSELGRADSRIKAIRNSGTGKVDALNIAYTHADGELVTTLDSDDALEPAYFGFLGKIGQDDDVVIRDYRITDDRLRPVSVYRMSGVYLTASFERVVGELISLPRGTWTMRRAISNRVFPIPGDLPFEDVWFSLVIKRFAKRIERIPEPAYLYRQHSAQTFGGVLSYNPAVVRFRAERLLAYSRALPRLAERFELRELPPTSVARNYYELMARSRLPIRAILSSTNPPRLKLALIVFRKLWILVSLLKRIQWALEAVWRR